MVNKILLKYVIKKEIYQTYFLCIVSLALLLSGVLSVVIGDIIYLVTAIVIIILVIISIITSEYERLIRTDYDFNITPLLALERKYSKISTRLDELTFLDINKEETSHLKIVIKEYEEAIDSLKK